MHADTPSVGPRDALGRPFLTSPTTGSAARRPTDPPIEELHATPRRCSTSRATSARSIDAEDRVVMRYDYDMLGTPRPPGQHGGRASAGCCNDVAGQADPRLGQPRPQLRTEYDALRRPVRARSCADRRDPARERADRAHGYGEQQPDAERRNLRGQAVPAAATRPAWSPARRTTSRATCSREPPQLAREYKSDRWTGRPPAGPRPDQRVRQLAPPTTRSTDRVRRADRRRTAASIAAATYNEASLLERLRRSTLRRRARSGRSARS